MTYAAGAMDLDRKTHDIIVKVAADAGQVVVEIADVAGNVADVSKRVQKQNGSMNQVHKAAQALASVREQIAKATHHALEKGKKADEDVEASQGKVTFSLTQIAELVSFVQGVGARLEDVTQALDNVRQVSSIIQKIASQTNLLALNATIEAARAGEAGKGFAVVAGEVKNLATQTSKATEEIDATMDALSAQVGLLRDQSKAGMEQAAQAQNGTRDIGDAVRLVGDVIGDVTQSLDNIFAQTQLMTTHVDHVVTQVDTMTTRAEENQQDLERCTQQVVTLRDFGSSLIQLTNQLGVETVDRFFIEKLTKGAKQVEGIFEQALNEGRLTEDALFDQNYQEIDGPKPQQYRTGALDFLDEVLPDVQEPIKESHEKFVFAACVDTQGYLPVHNAVFSQTPRPDDEEWNTGNCRNRRIFNDPVGLAAGQNVQPFLIQAYRRDMGGGNHVMMKDASVPIYVRGRHWGGLRAGYKL